VPPEGNNQGTKYPTPYQAIGARGVNNLASKLLLALFPPNAGFFRLSIADFELEKLTQQRGMRGEIDEILGKIERTVTFHVETSAIRMKMFEALKQLITAGNVLVHLLPDGSVRLFPISRYVTKRDAIGTVLVIITKEDISPLALPENIKEACGITNQTASEENNLSIYTHVKLVGDKYEYHQELNGQIIPDSNGECPKDACPFIPLRFVSVENEDYGRSYVEEYIGDLKSLEGLSKAMIQAAAISAKILFFMKPNSSISKKRLAEAENGEFIDGNIDDVGILQLDKYADFRVAYEQAQELTRRLSLAFLENSAVRRDGERVTAEEIRLVAGELEDALGGIYSVLSIELQLPLVKLLMKLLTDQGKLPQIPADTIQPMITTGLEALGRGHDLNKLTQLIQQIMPLGGDVIQTYLNIGDYITRVGTALGIDTAGLVKTQEEIQQEQQRQQMMQMAQNVAPNIANAMANQSQQQ
jgi:hypothetical protein